MGDAGAAISPLPIQIGAILNMSNDMEGRPWTELQYNLMFIKGFFELDGILLQTIRVTEEHFTKALAGLFRHFGRKFALSFAPCRT